MIKRILFIISVFSFSFSFAQSPKYEFRGVWIATVSNVDWPNRGSWDESHQKEQFLRLLDFHRKNGLNAVIVQVRPAADAFYPSPYEPWSQWLTGVQGKAPDYDPLKWMIDETHKRGMEFHAWLNPYRAVFNVKSSSVTADHITKKHPEWFLTYGDTKYFDPANKEGQKFVVDVVHDIVKRYDVDGIHMDDYFYPYPLPGKEFPDDASYRKSGTTLSKADWRRSNTDSIIRAIGQAIKHENKYVKFGISPFGVWRNKSVDPERGSNTLAGPTNYDYLYADILLWLEKGWIDYVTPQIYFNIGHSKVDFKTTTDWWAKYSYGRHVYVGHGIYKAVERDAQWRKPSELPDQISYLRQNEDVQGSVLYSSRSIGLNPYGWVDSLRNNYYKYPALVPPMKWISDEKPRMPLIEKTIIADSIMDVRIKADPKNNVPVRYYVVYQYIANPSSNIYFDTKPEFISRFMTTPEGFHMNESLSEKNTSYHYLITAVGKNNIESAPVEINLHRLKNGAWAYY
jgi:uncharacterized lipoprotein YddW (UPF0748 family)